MARSPERAAEVAAQDKVEAAFAAVDELPEKSRARVRAWAAEEYGWPEPPAVNGAAPAAGAEE
jgi:hypothetical protein